MNAPWRIAVFAASSIATAMCPPAHADSWKNGAKVPVVLQGGAAVAVGSKIYLVGGQASGSGNSPTYIYDPGTNTWSTAASMPVTYNAGSAVTANGLIYLVGGSSIEGSRSAYEYSPETDSWLQLHNPKGTGIFAGVAIAGNLIYAAGGYGDYANSKATVSIFHVQTNRWTKGPSLLVGKYGSATGAIGLTIVSAGGEYFDGGSNLTTTDNEAIHSKAKAWTSLANMPVATSVSCSGVINGSLYVVSGLSSGSSPIGNTQIYNLGSNGWSSGAPIPTPVVEPASAVYGGKLYCFGGYKSGFGKPTADTQIYSP